MSGWFVEVVYGMSGWFVLIIYLGMSGSFVVMIYDVWLVCSNALSKGCTWLVCSNDFGMYGRFVIIIYLMPGWFVVMVYGMPGWFGDRQDSELFYSDGLRGVLPVLSPSN